MKNNSNHKLIQQYIEEASERKVKQSKIRQNILNHFPEMREDIIKKRSILSNDTLFSISLPSFIKQPKEKTINDILIISLYLITMKKFLKLFDEDETTIMKNDKLNERFKIIILNLIYKKVYKNKLLFKFGDKGNQFYLILKGDVQVLIPTKKIIYMSIKEFKKYLLLLFIYKEKELMKVVLRENKDLDLIDFQDIVEAFSTNQNFDHPSFTNINTYNIQENENLKRLLDLYLTENEKKYYTENKNNKDDFIEDLTPNEYTQRILNFSEFNIDFNEQLEKIKNEENINNNGNCDLDKKRNFVIYEYIRVTDLNTGDTFGDLALSSANNKTRRTATIMTIENCHFGCLSGKIFDELIKEGNERIRKKKIDYLSNINILKNFPAILLGQKYFNNFAFKNIQKDKFIVKMNEINNDVIFLKEGLYEVSFSGNLGNLNELINFYFKQYLKLKNKNRENEYNDEDLIEKVAILNTQNNKISRLFQKTINDVFTQVLFSISAPSIFGLRSTEKKKYEYVKTSRNYNYISNCTIKCISQKGEYVYIDKNIFYKQIFSTDSSVKEETIKCAIEYLTKMINMLINIRYNKIWSWFVTNCVEKNYCDNVDLTKYECSGNISNAVDKIVNCINEGQLLTNDVSKYIFNYYETHKKLLKNQRHQLKILNHETKNDTIKTFILKKTKNFFNNELRNNNYNKKILCKNNSVTPLVKMDSIYPKNQKILFKKDQKSIPKIFKNISLFVSRSGENITIDNYLSKIKGNENNNKKNTILEYNIRKRFKAENHYYSCISKFNNDNTVIKNRTLNIIKPKKVIIHRNDDKDYSLPSCSFFKKAYKTSEMLHTLKKINDKYIKNNKNYIMKNTRLAFTRAQDIDKIIRGKRNASV